MTIYYRADLAWGVTAEQRPGGFYSKSPELGKTVFKDIRVAKKKFDQMAKDEIARLRALHKDCKAIVSRQDVIARTNRIAAETPEVPDGSVSAAENEQS